MDGFCSSINIERKQDLLLLKLRRCGLVEGRKTLVLVLCCDPFKDAFWWEKHLYQKGEKWWTPWGACLEKPIWTNTRLVCKKGIRWINTQGIIAHAFHRERSQSIRWCRKLLGYLIEAILPWKHSATKA